MKQRKNREEVMVRYQGNWYPGRITGKPVFFIRTSNFYDVRLHNGMTITGVNELDIDDITQDEKKLVLVK